MAHGNGNREESAEPQSNRWYPLTLGSSLVDHSSSTKFCTLRYEFKPASIDKTQPGTLHKNKENRVSIEFHNNQPGKPKVAFEGSSEDHKDTDAVLFFDGDTLRLEKLHRAFKSLKHKRVPGESNGLTGLNGAGTNGGGSSAEAHSPPLPKVARTQAVNRPSVHALPVEVEKIDIGGPENNAAPRAVNNKANTAHQSSNPNPFSPSYPDTRPYDHDQDHDEHLDILGDDEPGTPNHHPSSHQTSSAVGFDINVPNHHAESDDDIDLFDDMPAEHDGLSAAEALRAQVTGSGMGDAQFDQEGQGQETSSSGGESSSSGSSSASGSRSASSSSSSSQGSDADGGGADSASSAGDIDIG